MTAKTHFTPDMFIPQHVQPIVLGLGRDGAHWRPEQWKQILPKLYAIWVRSADGEPARIAHRVYSNTIALTNRSTRPAWRNEPDKLRSARFLGYRLSVLYARAHNGSDPPEIDEVMELAQAFMRHTAPIRLNDDRIRAAFEALAEAASIPLGFCAQCGEPIDTEDDDNRHSDTYDGLVCESCAEDHVYLEDTDQFVDLDRTYVYWAYTRWSSVSSEFCDERAFGNHSGLCLIHPDVQSGHVEYVTTGAFSDSYWSWRDDDDGSGVHPDGQPDTWDEDSEKLGVCGYDSHPYREAHRGYFGEPDGASNTNVPIGMELEVYVEGQPLDALRQAGNLDWILERDGSLDDEHGVEIVSPPLLRSQWEDTLPRLIDGLQSEDATAYNTPDGEEYGIHLTISRAYLTPLQEFRLSMFLVAEENGDFVRAIAQRWTFTGPTTKGVSAPTTRAARRSGPSAVFATASWIMVTANTARSTLKAPRRQV